MRISLCLLTLSLGHAAWAEPVEPPKLSVAEHLKRVDEQRQNATRLHCCDWGGGGCDPALVRQMLGLAPSKLAIKLSK